MTPAEKQKERNRLNQLYWELDKKYEAAKGRRAITSILVFAVAYFVFFWIVDRPVGLDILGTAVAAIFIGGVHFWINTLIFSQLFRLSESENRTLESIRKQLSELENSKE